MSTLSRRLTVATAATASVAATPALAATGASPATPARAGTSLVSEIYTLTPEIRTAYTLSRGTVQGALFDSRAEADTAAVTVASVHADADQLPAKLEWVLGVELQGRGDTAMLNGEHETVYGHPTIGSRDRSAGLADHRLSSHYVNGADSQLGIPHPARTVEPNQAYRDKPTPAGPGTVRTPSGLVATISPGHPRAARGSPRRPATAR